MFFREKISVFLLTFHVMEDWISIHICSVPSTRVDINCWHFMLCSVTLQLLLKPKYSSIEKIKTIGCTYMAASGLDPGKEPQVLVACFASLFFTCISYMRRDATIICSCCKTVKIISFSTFLKTGEQTTRARCCWSSCRFRHFPNDQFGAYQQGIVSEIQAPRW